MIKRQTRACVSAFWRVIRTLYNCAADDAFGKEECVQETHQGCLARPIPARRRPVCYADRTAPKKETRKSVSLFLAQWEGFEPSCRF